MADAKITELTELTAPTDDDLLAIVDDPGGSPVTKKVTRQNLLKLVSAPADDVSASGFIISLTANQNQAFGDVCYIDSDGEAHIADASVIASGKALVMAVATITAGNPGNYLVIGVARDDSWAWTPGAFIYLSLTGTTTNTLTATAPSATDECIVILGIATHADRIFFHPQLVIVEHT